MLNIHFGDLPEAIYDTSVYFDNTYLDSWLEDDFSKKIIKAIDRATVLSPRAIDSWALGVVPVTSLSRGVKTLLLVDHKPDMVFNASTCGDNCAKWLLRIAGRHRGDITVNLYHLMDFDAGTKNGARFDIRIANTGEVVHDMGALVLAGGSLL